MKLPKIKQKNFNVVFESMDVSDFLDLQSSIIDYYGAMIELLAIKNFPKREKIYIENLCKLNEKLADVIEDWLNSNW